MVVPWDRVALGLERPPAPAQPVQNPVLRAREFERALGAEACAADVARAFGVTRACVCQYLTLLKRLPPDALERIADQRDAEALRRVSLRRLMEIAHVEGRAEQRRRLRALLGGAEPAVTS